MDGDESRDGSDTGAPTLEELGKARDTMRAGSGQMWVQALSDYAPQQEGELGFRAGDVIEVLQQAEPGGWWGGALNGQQGWFPSHLCSEPRS